MKKLINVEMGKRIKDRRGELGFTREKLAEIIDVSTQFLASLEHGLKGPSCETLKKLTVALCATSDYFLFGAKDTSGQEMPELAALINDVSPQYLALITESVKMQLRHFAEVSEDKR